MDIRVYAYPPLKITWKVKFLYVFSVLFTISVFFGLQIFLLSLYTTPIPEKYTALQITSYVALLSIISFTVALLLALVPAAIMVYRAGKRGLEEHLNVIQENIRDGRENRLRFMGSVLKRIVISIPTIILIEFLVLITGLFVYLTVTIFLDYVNLYITVLMTLALVSLPFYARKQIRQKIQERQEMMKEQAEYFTEVKYKITAYTPGFLGQEYGVVTALKKQMWLYNRYRTIEDVVYRHPYLLIRDKKNTVFLWTYRTTWVFSGTMWRKGENMFEFVKEDMANYMTQKTKVEVTKIREVGSKILFEIDGQYHIVDEVSGTIGSSLLDRDVVDVVQVDQQVAMILERDGELLFSTKEREYSLGLSEGVLFVHASSVVYVCRRNSIDIYSFPPTRKLTRIDFEQVTSMTKVRSGDNLVTLAWNGEKAYRENFLITVTPRGIMSRRKIPVSWNIFYFKGGKYHLAEDNLFLIMDEGALQRIIEHDYGEESGEVIAGEKVLEEATYR